MLDAGAAARDGYLSPLQLARLSVKAQLYTRVKNTKTNFMIYDMVLFEFLLWPIIFEKGAWRKDNTES